MFITVQMLRNKKACCLERRIKDLGKKLGRRPKSADGLTFSQWATLGRNYAPDKASASFGELRWAYQQFAEQSDKLRFDAAVAKRLLKDFPTMDSIDKENLQKLLVFLESGENVPDDLQVQLNRRYFNLPVGEDIFASVVSDLTSTEYDCFVALETLYAEKLWNIPDADAECRRRMRLLVAEIAAEAGI
jgi:hypothetical protein